ncbi:MAG: hydroxymethylglutaryl-CoA synthase family protein [Myxococcaceae bacterium]
MQHRVGVEALALAVPHRFLDLEDLARARGIDPAKFTQGLGAKQMAVPDPGEDAPALAATAAKRALAASGIDVSRIGMVIVGTETGVDHSKAVASYVQGMLKLPRTVRTFDTQHACYGATAALHTAAQWIASGASHGKAALVVGADLARYGLKTVGEPTQGGGAVAMVVSDSPDLLELDFGVSGVDSLDVHDFWRPVGRREALVDGHYSIRCYLDALTASYTDWKQQALSRELVRKGDTLVSEQLARIAYHVPFCKMARKAHAQLRRVDLQERRGGKAWDEQAEAEEAPKLAASFETQVAPTLPISARVGNAYTASLYLGIASMLNLQAPSLVGKRVGLFSYGSGCTSEFFSAVVADKAVARIAAANIEDILAARERIDVEEYERLMGLASDAPLPTAPAPGTFRLEKIQEGRRIYAAG